MFKKLLSRLKENPFYIIVPIYILTTGYVVSETWQENTLSSGRGAYIPDLMCTIEVDDERSAQDMRADLEECLTLHKNKRSK